MSKELSDVENSGSESDEEVNVSNEFKECVVKYSKLCDLIDVKKEELSVLRKQLKPLSAFIQKNLEKLDEDEIKITNGVIKKTKNERPATLNIDLIKEALTSKLKNPVDVNDLIKTIETSRPIIKTTKIEKIKNKNRKAKKETKPAVKV